MDWEHIRLVSVLTDTKQKWHSAHTHSLFATHICMSASAMPYNASVFVSVSVRTRIAESTKALCYASQHLALYTSNHPSGTKRFKYTHAEEQVTRRCESCFVSSSDIVCSSEMVEKRMKYAMWKRLTNDNYLQKAYALPSNPFKVHFLTNIQWILFEKISSTWCLMEFSNAVGYVKALRLAQRSTEYVSKVVAPCRLWWRSNWAETGEHTSERAQVNSETSSFFAFRLYISWWVRHISFHAESCWLFNQLCHSRPEIIQSSDSVNYRKHADGASANLALSCFHCMWMSWRSGIGKEKAMWEEHVHLFFHLPQLSLHAFRSHSTHIVCRSVFPVTASKCDVCICVCVVECFVIFYSIYVIAMCFLSIEHSGLQHEQDGNHRPPCKSRPFSFTVW